MYQDHLRHLSRESVESSLLHRREEQHHLLVGSTSAGKHVRLVEKSCTPGTGQDTWRDATSTLELNHPAAPLTSQSHVWSPRHDKGALVPHAWTRSVPSQPSVAASIWSTRFNVSTCLLVYNCHAPRNVWSECQVMIDGPASTLSERWCPK